jgi:hypothetical protein
MFSPVVDSPLAVSIVVGGSNAILHMLEARLVSISISQSQGGHTGQNSNSENVHAE